MTHCICLNLLALVQWLSIFGKKYTVDRRGLSKSCCVQTNDKYTVLFCFHRCLPCTVSLSIQELVEMLLRGSNHSVTLKWNTVRFVIPNNSFVPSTWWIIAASGQFGWTRSSKHLLLNSPKWNPKLKSSSSLQLQAIITIMFQGLSSQHQVP